ncbi:hypothetical protein BC835DRAFT_1277344 [Cytidiella melzeri]|nr:hypothetical protein BC835DRAFT_1277344 [Cytidiella melzeri]
MTGSSDRVWESYYLLRSIRCVAYSHASQQVLFAGSRSIYNRNLFETRKPEGVLLSLEPQQIHVHPANPSVVILEVKHLDRQVQVYDLRRSSFNARPSLEFGHRESRRHAGQHTKRGEEVQFTKGHIDGERSLFARGYYGDGTVHLWDYRNIKKELKQFERQREPVTHTVVSGDTLIAYGGYHVTFWKRA